MSEIVRITITTFDDLSRLSEWYQKGAIKLNLSKIARELNCDRKTVKRRLEGVVPKTTRKRGKYLDDFKPLMLSYLQDTTRHFSYIDHLFYFMRREHYITCARSTFYRYIVNDEDLIQSFKQNTGTSFTQRFETQPGQQAQFDLKEKVKLVTKEGQTLTAYIPTLTLSWSRYNVRRLILNPTTENLLSFLAEAFEEIGGVPQELVIDNLKAFVEKPRTSTGDQAVLTSRFSEFCKDYGIKPIPCMPYRPQTKGRTETQNKWVEQLYNYNGTYEGIMDMHRRLKQINNEDNHAASQATRLPRYFLLEKEKGDLIPLPSLAVRRPYHLHFKKVHVTNDSLFQYRYNKYSIAKEFIGKQVEIVVQNNKLYIYYNGNMIDSHPITNQPLNIKPEHQLYYVKQKNDTREKEVAKEPSIISMELGGIRYDNLS